MPQLDEKPREKRAWGKEIFLQHTSAHWMNISPETSPRLLLLNAQISPTGKAEEIFIFGESQEQEFQKNQARSSSLINNNNIRKSPGPQRETSGPRIWPLGCTSPGDCSSGYESWKQGSHILPCERCLFFLLLQPWASVPCLPPRLPAAGAARWTPVSRNGATLTDSLPCGS